MFFLQPPQIKVPAGISKIPYLPHLISGRLKMRKLSSVIEDLKPELILNVNFLSLFEPIPSDSAIKFYYVHRLLGQWPVSYINPRLYLLSRPVLTIYDTYLYNYTRKGLILANSAFTLSSYKKRGCRGSVVYYPCNIKNFSPSPNKKDLVVSVGRISPERAHEYTLKIARYLPNTRFLIIGRPQDQKYYYKLMRLRPPNITIIASVPREEIIKILSRAKVYVSSRYVETFGVAIIEAMASGCVPVVRDHGAPRETVTEDVGFRWKTIEEAAGYIKNLLSDEDLWREKSIHAVERAKDFTPEKFETRVANALNKFL